MNYSSHKFFDDNVVREKESWITGRINNHDIPGECNIFNYSFNCHRLYYNITRRREGNKNQRGVTFTSPKFFMYVKKDACIDLFAFARADELSWVEISIFVSIFSVEDPKHRQSSLLLSPKPLIRIISTYS